MLLGWAGGDGSIGLDRRAEHGWPLLLPLLLLGTLRLLLLPGDGPWLQTCPRLLVRRQPRLLQLRATSMWVLVLRCAHPVLCLLCML